MLTSEEKEMADEIWNESELPEEKKPSIEEFEKHIDELIHESPTK